MLVVVELLEVVLALVKTQEQEAVEYLLVVVQNLN